MMRRKALKTSSLRDDPYGETEKGDTVIRRKCSKWVVKGSHANPKQTQTGGD
jgi:hypothetical protein